MVKCFLPLSQQFLAKILECLARCTDQRNEGWQVSPRVVRMHEQIPERII